MTLLDYLTGELGHDPSWLQASDTSSSPPGPRLHLLTLPDAAGGQDNLGVWKVRRALDDAIDALSTDAQQLGDLGHTHEVMSHRRHFRC